MRCSSQIYSCGQWLIKMVAIVVLISVGGCGDFITDKSAGREATRIINTFGGVRTTPEPNVPIPAFYKEPPKIIEQTVGGATEYKLFYFCKHHNSDELKKIIETQFGSVLFDVKGKSKRVPDYTVSSVPATNQLIVRTPAREDIDSVVEFLQQVDVPPIQVKIDCLISEIYADKTLDWETTLQIENLLGERITMGGSALPFGSDIAQQLIKEGDVLPAFPGARLRDIARSKMGLKVGYLSTSGKFLAVVDLLESQGYLKILMNPTLEVVNGKTAKISSSQHVPLQQIGIRGSTGAEAWVETRTEYIDIVDSLEVTPHVYLGDGSIGLETKITLGSKLTPEGVKQVSIVTKKEIENKENRIRPGESLIIGGIRKSERRDVVRGIPFLKDIPLLGMLFSGRDFEERVVETIFILTPSISTGGIPREEMMEKVKGDHELADSGNDVGFDPFGMKKREKEQQHELEDAEQVRLEANAQKAEARNAVRDAKYRIEKAESEAKLVKDMADRKTVEAEKAKAEAQAAKAEADAKAKAADEAKAAADKAVADAAKTNAEAVKLKADADKAVVDAAKATTDASKTKEEALKIKAEAVAKTKAAEKALAEAEAKGKAADKAIADAAKAATDAATAKAQAEKDKIEAEAKIKAAEEQATADAQAKAEAERIVEQARADAEARIKAAEQARTQAEARAEAAEQAWADAEARAEVAEKAIAGIENADNKVETHEVEQVEKEVEPVEKENYLDIVEVARNDKPGNKVETHEIEKPTEVVEIAPGTLNTPEIHQVAGTHEEISTVYAQITDFRSEIQSILALAKEQQEEITDDSKLEEKEKAELNTPRAQPRTPQVITSKGVRIGRLGSALLRVNVIVAPTVMLIITVVLGLCWSVRKKHYISQAGSL